MGANQPKLKIKNTPLDYFITGITLIALLLTFILPALNFDILPNDIPTHFNGKGEPDNYSSKQSIWLLPIISLLMTAGLFWLRNKPHLFNYPTTVNDTNATHIYRVSKTMVGFITVFIVISFLYITSQSIAMALDKSQGLGNWFLPVFIGGLLLIIIYSLSQMNKAYKA